MIRHLKTEAQRNYQETSQKIPYIMNQLNLVPTTKMPKNYEDKEVETMQKVNKA